MFVKNTAPVEECALCTQKIIESAEIWVLECFFS